MNSHNSIVGLNVSQFYAYAMCQDMAKISVENFLFFEEIYERNLFFNEFDIPEAECVGEPVERSIRRFEKKSTTEVQRLSHSKEQYLNCCPKWSLKTAFWRVKSP